MTDWPEKSSQSPQSLIDDAAHLHHRDRVAPRFDQFDFLKKAVTERIMDRVDTISRDLPHVLDIGCHNGVLTEALLASPKITSVSAMDPSLAMAALTKDRCGVDAVAAPYDAIPFEGLLFDGIFSAFALHWANDLPGVLIQLRQRLKPDGVMMVALAGGETLAGLRGAMASAETEISGGMSPRVLPMGDIRDMGGLISRAGLTMPVADSDTITVTYDNLFSLMADLRGMGEVNAMHSRVKRMTSKSVFMRAAEIYQQRFSTEDGRIKVDFEIVTLTGWAPDASQPQPLKPGSASQSLASALGVDERGVGEGVFDDGQKDNDD